jgi:hypothetical protein
MENYVQYAIYGSNISENTALEINALVLTLFPDYIWQKESFHLHFSSGILKGKTKFGDCIMDEWYIVFLLRLISKEYQDFVISVYDNDGQFLLIEAAEFLPSDFDPEIMDHRVFIHQFNLHIVPPNIPVASSEEGVAMIHSNASVETKVCEKIQNAAFRRIESYPDQILQLQHHSKVVLPHKIAHILHKCPRAIAVAVESIYSRDPAKMKYCNDMKMFHPSTNVPITITFTRTLYAQLASIHFQAPSAFFLPPKEDPEFNSHDIGMKIACGFEILFSTFSQNAVDETKFIDYKRTLDRMGFFKGEIEGSTLYRSLEQLARQHFIPGSQDEHFFVELSRILEEPMVIPSQLYQGPSDDDSWLYMEEESVDKLLEKHDPGLLSDDDEDSPSLDENEKHELEELTTLVGGIDQFVEKESGVKGVLAPGELSDDESDDEYLPVTFEPTKYLGLVSQTENIANSYNIDTEQMDQVLAKMDVELSEARNADFERGDDGEVNANFNLAKNLLDSFSAQEGLAGPITTILSSLGLALPKPNLQ